MPDCGAHNLGKQITMRLSTLGDHVNYVTLFWFNVPVQDSLSKMYWMKTPLYSLDHHYMVPPSIPGVIVFQWEWQQSPFGLVCYCYTIPVFPCHQTLGLLFIFKLKSWHTIFTVSPLHLLVQESNSKSCGDYVYTRGGGGWHTIFTVNPFTAPAGTISRLKDVQMRMQTVYFSLL